MDYFEHAMKLQELGEYLGKGEFIIYGSVKDGGRVDILSAGDAPREDVLACVNTLMEEYIREAV